jgi:hypothetical protein
MGSVSPSSPALVGGAAPILDDKGRNVPDRVRFTRKHYQARAKIRDSMRLWRREGCVLWWATLTSSPESALGTLRRNFQVWRKRLARLLELDARDIRYCMVDTREGHGVLHFVLAFPEGHAKRLDYSLLGAWWQEIHGARQVKFLPVRDGDGSTRRLSHYLIAQYMVVQGKAVDLLGRISTSRLVADFASWRRTLRDRLCGRADAYVEAHRLSLDHDGYLSVRREQFRRFRFAWDELMSRGWCSVGDDKLVLSGLRLEVL